MASSSGAQGPSTEVLVSEAFVKAVSIVLAARIPTLQPSKVDAVEASKRRAWFNLEVPEDAGAQSTLQRWRKDVGLPLVLEIFLQPWGARDPLPGTAEPPQRVDTLLERWVLHYQPMLPETPTALSRSQLLRLNPSSVYKRLIIMLRSVFSYVRVLPAYRMYRACKRQRSSNFSIGYRIHSTLPGRAAAGMPGGRRLQSFAFSPVDTPYGQFRVSVDYQPASTVTILEQTTSPPPLPQIIADYVGSPVAAAGGMAGRAGRPPMRHAMSASVFGSSGERAASGAGGGVPVASSPSGTAHGMHWTPSSGASGTTPPVRRSWSTTMRGLSPSRLPSPPSPHTALGSYGSAPQHGGLFGPANVRSLTARPVAGSPSSGKPPLARPPRTSSGGQPGLARAASIAEGQEALDSGPLLSSNAAEHADAEAAAQAGSARQTSAPVCIPRGSASTRGRRLRSSGDLWAMQQAANMHKPLSAPAVTHMRRGTPEASEGAAAAAAAQQQQQRTALESSPSEGALLPPTPLPVIPGTMESESSGSTASSLFPTSCSPQLPFAFTPSAQSGSILGRGPLSDSVRLDRTSPGYHTRSPAGAVAPAVPLQQQHQQRPQGGSSGQAAPGAAGSSYSSSKASPVSGREVSTSMALLRRPSWAGRSSLHAEAGPASGGGVGYSVSPMADPTLESLLAGSTPRQFAAVAGLPSPGLAAGVLVVSRSVASPQQLLTYPSTSAEMMTGLDEHDALPFALDGDGAAPFIKPASPALPAPGSATGALAAARPATAAAGQQFARSEQSVQAPQAAGDATGHAVDASADAAVGAFVRLLQEAPPLRGSGNRCAVPDAVPAADEQAGAGTAQQQQQQGQQLTLQAGLQQLAGMRQRLQTRGLLPPAVPA